MATFNESSIGNFASCIKRHQILLTKLFYGNEAMYYSDVVAKINIKELLDYHVVEVLGKEILSLTPTFKTMISLAFSITQLVSDHDVLRYKDKLEKDIEDCIISKGNKGYEYLQNVKSDLAEVMMVMSSSVDNLSDAVENDFKYLEDHEIKKNHLERYLNLTNKLYKLRGEIDKTLQSDTMKRLKSDFNDSDLDFLVSTCYEVFMENGTKLLKLLPTIRTYLNEIRRQYETLDKIRRLMALKNEGTLDRIENSNLREYLSSDFALWHESPQQRPFYISLDYLRNSPTVGDVLQHAKIRYDLAIARSQPAGPVDPMYSQETVTDRRLANPREIIEHFTSSGQHLFEFIEHYDFGKRITLNERINYYVFLACVYHARLDSSNEYVKRGEKSILVLYPKI